MQPNGEIRLREIREDDLLFFYSMYSSPEVMRYTLIDACAGLKEYMPYFQKSLRDAAALARVRFEYVAELDGARVGMGDIDTYGQTDSAEIGYMLLPPFWGKGYATQIARKLLTVGFTDMRLLRMFARCNANNAASERVMKKCGMRLESVGVGARYKKGTWQDELCYTMSADEWHGLQARP